MRLNIRCDEKTLDIKITLSWISTIGLLKALIPLAAAITGLIAAPDIGRLGSLLGWW